MSVKVREKPKGSGIYYIFINHKGRRKSKRIKTNKKTADEIAEKINARLVLGEVDIKNKKTPSAIESGVHFSSIKPPQNPIGKYVYFAQQNNNGPVKIGITKNNIIMRISALKVSSPYLIRLVGYIKTPFPEDLENDLHYAFKKHRIRGEWFKPDIEIWNFVKKEVIPETEEY